MTTKHLNIILKKIDGFPTLPTIAAQVLNVVAKPESTVGELAAVITPDPAMTMSILKMANSAFLGLPKKVVTLQHAVSIIGFDEIRNLVLAKAICQSFKSLNKHSKFDMRQFWTHSFLCGLAAKIIATQANEFGSELFVAGLVHDIGKLLIYMEFPEEYCHVAANNMMGGTQLAEMEKANFGLSHDEVGLRLAKRWFLPPNLTTAIGFHHQIHKAEELPGFAVMVYIADLLARIVAEKEMLQSVDGYRDLILSPETVAAARACQLDLSVELLEVLEDKLMANKAENIHILKMLLN